MSPEKISSSSPRDEEALWNFVYFRGWKPLYRRDRRTYRLLKGAAEKLLEDGEHPLMKAALARGRAVLPALRSAEGGSISVQEASKRLRVTAATLLKRYRNGGLIGFTEDGAVWFPVWQFKGNAMLPGVGDALNLMSLRQSDDNWRMLMFLSRYDSLGGKSVLQVLRAGRTDEALCVIRNELEL